MTAIDPEAMTFLRPSRAAAKAPKHWRQPAAKTQTDVVRCPVAALAKEAADALRLIQELRDETGDRTLIEALATPVNCVQPTEMRDALMDQLNAIINLASHRRASSLKGAIFQFYLAAHEGRHARGEMQTPLSAADTRLFEDTERKVARLQYGALAYLEAAALDDDLSVLRDWFQSTLYDVHRYCDGATHGRDKLIAEVLDLPRPTT